MNNEIKNFRNEVKNRVAEQENIEKLQRAKNEFFVESIKSQYSYNFSWMGRPIIQYPQDMIALQEIIWEVKPDLLIETGIAHGGSLIYYASLFEMMGKGEVLGIDIDIRSHNKIEIEQHRMYKRISMLEGSSVSVELINKVSEFVKGKEKIMVVLDSNHTHDHVLKELELYSPFVTKDSYLVVFDTVVEDLADLGETFPNRPWSKGNNPKTAVWEFLKNNDSYVIDKDIQNKLLLTVAPDGYLKRVK